eukprot:14761284-Heterocapsa_arctica.AAC.1
MQKKMTMMIDTGTKEGRQKLNNIVRRSMTEARKRAEETQAEINANKRRKHIEAHLKNTEFDLPKVDVSSQSEITDEQTNHSFSNGKEVRKKAMLKAKQI